MKLLLVNHEYPPIGGGAGNATYFLARALVRLGHTPWVLTSAYSRLPEQESGDGVEVRRIPAGRSHPDRGGFVHMARFGLAGPGHARRLAREQRFEGAIAFFTIPCAPTGVALRRSFGVPFIVSLRGGDVPGLVPELDWMHRVLTPWRRRLLRAASAVVANDQGLAELSRRTDPVPVEVIPNGVDTGYFSPAASSPPAPPFRFLFVGRLHPQKQLPLLLRAAAELARRAPDSFRLAIVGDGPDGPALRRLAGESGLDACIDWHGWVSKEALRTLYRQAHCFLNPSAYEGMPNTVLEAMACALPVIASRVPGNSTLVRPGETGMLFDCDQPAQLGASMESLLRDPARARAMGAAGRRVAATEYSWEAVARGYLRLMPLRSAGGPS